MPNWCSNRLTVTGPRADVKAFIEAARTPVSAIIPEDEDHDPVGGNINELDFNQFLPTSPPGARSTARR